MRGRKKNPAISKSEQRPFLPSRHRLLCPSIYPTALTLRTTPIRIFLPFFFHFSTVHTHTTHRASSQDSPPSSERSRSFTSSIFHRRTSIPSDLAMPRRRPSSAPHGPEAAPPCVTSCSPPKSSGSWPRTLSGSLCRLFRRVGDMRLGLAGSGEALADVMRGVF